MSIQESDPFFSKASLICEKNANGVDLLQREVHGFCDYIRILYKDVQAHQKNDMNQLADSDCIILNHIESDLVLLGSLLQDLCRSNHLDSSNYYVFCRLKKSLKNFLAMDDRSRATRIVQMQKDILVLLFNLSKVAETFTQVTEKNAFQLKEWLATPKQFIFYPESTKYVSEGELECAPCSKEFQESIKLYCLDDCDDCKAAKLE